MGRALLQGQQSASNKMRQTIQGDNPTGQSQAAAVGRTQHGPALESQEQRRVLDGHRGRGRCH